MIAARPRRVRQPRGLRTSPIRYQLRCLVVVLCALMFGLGAAAYLGIQEQNAKNAVLSDVVVPARDLNLSILQTMTNAETGLRGYLATRNDTLLEPFDGAQQQATAAQTQVLTLAHSSMLSADEQRDYTSMATAQGNALNAWWGYAKAALAGHPPNPTDALLAGKPLFDRVRATNSALQARLDAARIAGRAASQQGLNNVALAVLIATAVAVVVGLFLAQRISSFVTAPIARLRRVVRRQRDETDEVRADERDGPLEVRDLAGDFNVLMTRDRELVATQAEALRLQRLALDAEAASRRAARIDEAMYPMCAVLGEGLHARRLMFDTFHEDAGLTRNAQWHAPDLPDLPRLSDGVRDPLAGLAAELWNTSGSLLLSDLHDAPRELRGWLSALCAETGATALMVVPVGLGERTIGIIKVLMDDGPREWTVPELGTVTQVAGYLARVITYAEAEAQQAEYVAGLERLDRQKNDFLSTVSHELRTPLTSINGYLELLLDDAAGDVPEQQRQMLRVIERNTVRLRGLIEDLLVLNRIESGQLDLVGGEVSIRDLVTQLAEELRPVADKGRVRLRVLADPEAAVVSGDETYLQRALANIASNAIKFTPGGGEVAIQCAVDHVADQVVVTCRDTGIGIPEADVAHLFTRFFRASNATGQAIPGTGLGLAIVKTIMDAHQGSLWLESVEGKGTTVVLKFPLSGAAATSADHHYV